MATNTEVLRSLISTGDIGTPGANLLSPEQFEAFHELATTNHPWMALQNLERRTAHTGSVPRIDFTGDVITAASEGVDSGEFVEPSHSSVAYTMTKGRTAFKVTREAITQNIEEARYRDRLVRGMTAAWGRSHQKLAWLGDSASADPMLKLNDGWLKQIKASGNVTDGSTINGGVLEVAHFYAAMRSLPKAWQQRKNELRWAMDVETKWDYLEFLSGRATGEGDKAIVIGDDGQMRILGVPVVEEPILGTADIVLCAPANTTVVMDPTDFNLEEISQGLQVKLQDIVAYVGFFYADYILLEVEGTAVVENLV